MRRIASYAVGGLLLAGIGLALATQREDGGGPRPDGDLESAGAEAAEAAPPAGGRPITATLSGGAGARVRRPGEPGRVRVAVRRGDDGSAVPDVSLVLDGTPAGGVPFTLQAWTDFQGRAVFERVPEGTDYRLVTQLGAATPVERKGIVVVAGLETDVGTVVLLSAGIVLGMVLREDGSPIQDAVVTATTHPDTLLDLDQDPWPLAPDPPFFAAKTTTDLAGHFRLAGVPPGLVAIRATALGFRGRTERTWVPPQATSPGWVDLVLRPAPGLRVRVVDLKTLPLPGVAVSAGTWEDPGFLARVEGKTDEDGIYELSGFLGLPAVALSIPASEGDARLLFRDAGRGTEMRCVVIAASKVVIRVLAMEDDRPVPGAQAMLELGLPPELRDAHDAMLGTAVGETNDRGEVTLPVHRGAPVIGQVRSAERRTVPLGRNASLAVGGSYRTDGDLSSPMLPGESRTITVRVATGLRLEVTVVDPRNVPVPGATVTLVDALGAGGIAQRTGPDGVAAFDRVVPDHRLTLTAAAPGFATTKASTPRELRLKEWTSVRVRLEKGLSLRGVVNDGTGRPLAGARVQAEVGGPVARTGADGAYVLEGVPVVVEGRARPATLRVRAWADGFAARTTPEFTAQPGPVPQPVPTIVLGVGNELRGVVLDHERMRVPHPVLEVVGADGKPVRTGTGSALGEFTLRDVPPGTWRLVALAPGLVARLPDSLKIEDDVDPPFVTLAAQARTWVEFQVVDARDRPVAGARLEPGPDRRGESSRLAGLGSAGGLPSLTDAGGRLRVAALSLPRTVRISLQGFDPQEIVLENDPRPDPIRVRWYLPHPNPKPRPR